MERLNLDVEVIAAFIEKIHLFRSLGDDALFEIAERLEEKQFETGQMIVESGQASQDFYIIYSGRVEVTQEGQGQQKAIFVSGDYLGEEAVLPNIRRQASAHAKEPTIVFVLSQDAIDEIPSIIASMRHNLTISVRTRRLIKEKHFDWILEDEVIYFLMRKHPILFWEKMILPLLVGFAGFASLVFWYMNPTVPENLWYVIMGVLGVFGIMLGWTWLDWRNDYYIVTNQRVIWLEKVIALYDSRQEANLPEVLSVSENTDVFEHLFFDAGTVTVRTMVGNIVMRHMHYPHQARFIIEEQWQRARALENRQAKKELRKAIEEKLKEPVPLEAKKRKEPPKKKTLLERIVENRQRARNSMKLRYEEGKTITYRKHTFILFKRILIPSVVTIMAFAVLFWQLFLQFWRPESVFLPMSVLFLYAFVCVITLLWPLYQYEDWRNDIFQVTEDKIFDIDKKPLGDVQSRSAPLENIQSTEYERRGFFSILLNYGTVYINIGAESFEFENVWSPADVQQDINRRYVARRRKQEEAEAKQERENMLDWLIAYHDKSLEFDEISQQANKAEESMEEDGYEGE